MMQSPEKSRVQVAGQGPAADPGVECLVPVVHGIRLAIDELRLRFDEALAGLRRQIEGKQKSHYTVDEVAALTGRAPYTVRAWIKKGLIDAVRIGGTGPKGRLLVPCAEIQRLVEGGKGRWVSAVSAGRPAEGLANPGRELS